MNNPLSNINSNISKRKGTFENTNQPIEGKTIQFEGRNVAPSIPKIFGSLGRRQYPPGFYGQPPQVQSYYEQSLSYNNNANNMQLQRRSMYGKIESNYYNPEFYSSFSRPQLSKIRTTDYLRNRNSLYANLSEIEHINKNDHQDVSSITSTTTNATIKSIKEVLPSNAKMNAHDLKKNNISSKIKEFSESTSSINPSLSKPSTNNKSITNEKIKPQQQQSNDQNLITSSTVSPSSSNKSTPKLSHNTPETEDQKLLLNDNSNSKSNINTNNINNDINLSTINELEKIPNNNIPNKTIDTNTTHNIDITSKENSSTTSTSSTNNSNSTAKGKDVIKNNTNNQHNNNQNNNDNNNNNNEEEDTIQPIIPRPRPRPRPRNPVAYRNMDEMDLNYMPISRYNHYQQIKEIPGFQYLISEFPKLRTTQNKRYSSIF